MKKILLLSSILATILFFSGCFGGLKPRSKEILDQGKVSGTTYTNPYFSFEMQIDTSWFQKEIEKTKFKRPFEADLLRVSNYVEDSNYIDDAYLYIYAEKTNPFSNDPKKYLLDLKEGLDFFLDESDSTTEVIETKIDGIPFHMLSLKMEDPDNELTTYQEFYATPIKDYWLIISKTYCYEKQKAVIEKMFQSIRFKRK
jgi:hypothetical protein